MSYLDYWFENVVSTADLISSPDALVQAWIRGDKSITSAYEIDELLEQLLGDLHLRENIHQFEESLRQMGALSAVSAFAEALFDLEKILRGDSSLQDPQNLLASPAWGEIKRLATGVTQLPAAKTYTRRNN